MPSTLNDIRNNADLALRAYYPHFALAISAVDELLLKANRHQFKVGEPDFDTPDYIKEARLKPFAIQSFTPVEGIKADTIVKNSNKKIIYIMPNQILFHPAAQHLQCIVWLILAMKSSFLHLTGFLSRYGVIEWW